MRLVSLAALALLAPTADALASPACSGPWFPTYAAPAGCPVHVIERGHYSGQQPEVELVRDGEPIAVTPTITSKNITLETRNYEIGCDYQSGSAYFSLEPGTQHDILVEDAQPGDTIVVSYFGTATIQEAGPCYPALVPSPECSIDNRHACPLPEPEPEPDDDELRVGFACSTGSGSAGLPLVLALAMLLVRRRRGEHA